MPSIIYNLTENVDPVGGRGFSRWVSRASDAQLRQRESELSAQQDAAALDESLDEEQFGQQFDTLQDQIDVIRDELRGRAWDREDPSSGLGCHQPT